MIHEFTKQAPQLVDISKFKLKPTAPIVKKRKWNINKILLIGFAIFSVFFLYNTRYGIFRQKEFVVPYQIKK